jgi:hypothetical protein
MSSAKLADRFEEWLAFDVADGAADFRDHDIGLFIGQLPDDALDFVGDMRNDLDRLAQEFSTALLFDHRQINLAGGVVGIRGSGDRA